jgi:hypothetical protein
MESITVSISRKTPLTEQILRASEDVSRWLKTLDRPIQIDQDRVRLTAFERVNGEYRGTYTVYRGIPRKRFV